MPVRVDVAAVVVNLGGHGSLAVARTLGRMGVAVHGVHVGARTPASRSRYFRSVHVVGEEDLVDTLAALGRRLGDRPVLLSTGDADTAAIEGARPVLSQVFRLPQSSPGLARSLVDKQALRALCAAHGMRMPPACDNPAAADALRFPVVVKQRAPRSRQGTTHVVVDDPGGLAVACAAFDEPVVIEELVPGEDWLYNACFAAGGRPIKAFTGRKVHQCPPTTGTTSLGEATANPDLESLLTSFLSAVGYAGVVDCDVRRDERDGSYCLLDVNPRVGDCFRLFVDDHGLDVVRLLYLDLTGQPCEPGEMQSRRWAVLVNEAVAFAQLRAAGAAPPARSYWSAVRGADELAWWARDDLRPALAMAAETGRRVVRRVGGRAGLRRSARR